jgi:hypothetical protein
MSAIPQEIGLTPREVCDSEYQELAGRQAMAGTFSSIVASISARIEHRITRKVRGFDLSGSTRLVCSCGWIGPERYEWEEDKHQRLQADERGHLQLIQRPEGLTAAMERRAAA